RESYRDGLALVFEHLARRALAQFRRQLLERHFIAAMTQQNEARVAIARSEILSVDVRRDERAGLVEQRIESDQPDALADLSGTVDLDVHQAAAVLCRVLAREQRGELIEHIGALVQAGHWIARIGGLRAASELARAAR